MAETNTQRRAFLTIVASSVAVAACGGGGSSTPATPSPGPAPGPGPVNQPPSNMKAPLTIDLSQANLPAGAASVAYAYIIGGLYTDATLKNFKTYRLDASGNVQAIVPPNVDGTGKAIPLTGDNTIPANTFPDQGKVVSSGDTATINASNYPTDWADYAIPLSLTAPNYIELANINTTNIPGLGKGNNALSMRIYISLGVPKLPFTAQVPYTSTGGVTYANPYAGPGFDTGAPGALCLFDWFECSIDSSGVLNGNSTYVDQFGMPLIVNALPGGSPQGELNVTRTQVLSSIATFDQNVYAGLAQPVTAPSAYPSGTAYLRAISPDHLSGLGTSSGTSAFQQYFDTTIASWNGQQITVTDTSSGTYIGTPSAGSWTFNYHSGGVAGAGTPATLNYGTITTANLWQCSGTLASGGSAQLNIGKQILAAFNRGVMSTTLDDGNCPASTSFYPTGTASNLWSQSFHTWSKNGQAYGFAYDDVCGANPSFNTSGSLTALSITLGKMV